MCYIPKRKKWYFGTMVQWYFHLFFLSFTDFCTFASDKPKTNPKLQSTLQPKHILNKKLPLPQLRVIPAGI